MGAQLALRDRYGFNEGEGELICFRSFFKKQGGIWVGVPEGVGPEMVSEEPQRFNLLIEESRGEERWVTIPDNTDRPVDRQQRQKAAQGGESEDLAQHLKHGPLFMGKRWRERIFGGTDPCDDGR